jgi:hypothetical protein
MDYTSLTDQINSAITNISPESWNNVPGGLDKVSASAVGFAWGIGSGHAWVCQLPCEGNWKQVDTPEGTILDIITDETKVYVLLQGRMAMKSATNTDEWITVNTPDGLTKIISTASYIWAQAGDQKYKLPKPGMTGNWIPVEDKMNVTVTSASSGHLYGVDQSGNAMMTDESLQSAWSTIPELGSKYTSVIGGPDLFAIDSNSALQRCSDSKCLKVDTPFPPKNVTVSSDKIWLTTTSPGSSGNIFSKNLSSDFSDIIKEVQPIDAKRDQVVKEAELSYDEATYSGVMSKQFEILKKMIADVFDIQPKPRDKKIESKIGDMKYESNVLRHVLPFIQHMLIVLGFVIMVYAASDTLGDFTHIIALAVLISGTAFFAIHNGV